MSLTRRLFAKRAPLAAGAASLFASDVARAPAPATTPSPMGMLNKCGVEVARPYDPIREILQRKRNEYIQGMGELETLHRTIMGRSGGHSFNNNIMALRSVTHQHKVIMQENFYKKFQEERMTWREKLLSMIGLKPEEAWDENAPAQASSGRGW